MGETSKARSRRNQEDFFGKYCNGLGIDIGSGDDKLVVDNPNDWIEVDPWDFEQGDANYMEGVPDQKYDFVYSSHCIEHIATPEVALRHWLRILKTGGYLIVFMPHRDLYEKRKNLPSTFNLDHKFFIMPDKGEEPDTIGFRELVEKTWPDGEVEIEYIKTCDVGWFEKPGHSPLDAEYSIEAVLKKN